MFELIKFEKALDLAISDQQEQIDGEIIPDVLEYHERKSPYNGNENPDQSKKQPGRSLNPLEIKLNNDEEFKKKIQVGYKTLANHKK